MQISPIGFPSLGTLRYMAMLSWNRRSALGQINSPSLTNTSFNSVARMMSMGLQVASHQCSHLFRLCSSGLK